MSATITTTSHCTSNFITTAVNQTKNNISDKKKDHQMLSLLPVIKPEVFLSDRSLVAVYCFIKNFIG